MLEPHSHSKNPRSARSARRSLLALCLVLAACAARQPGDPLRPGFNVYSKEQDIELGRQAAAEIVKQVDVVDNRELQNYISQLGQRLAQQPESGGYPYQFTLINDDSINAFALPGGPIFVHSGLLEAGDNEAQVAGVLAHEISHVALRHGTAQASKASMIQLPAVLAGVAIGQESALAQLGQLGLGLGVNSLIMKYSRDAEREADALGARIMAQAGLDPIEMAKFFEKLEAQGGARGPQFLSSHPNPGDRVKNVQAELQTFPQRQYTAGSNQFPRMKQLASNLPPPRHRSQAAMAAANNPPAPSTGGFEQLATNRFAISYPSQWRVYGSQDSPVITMAPPQGLVRGSSGVALGYGAVVSYYPARGDLNAVTRRLLSDLQTMDPALRVAQSPRAARLRGMRALVTQLSGRSPYGGGETNLLLTVARPEGVFYVVLVAPEQHFGQAQSTFEQIVNSIQFRG
ncbi:MAG: M48 family metalloprotease [Bryobacteraceae bacterium]|nr:M48 family metalloprotease [Bryobacteraceae bacterium]